MEEFMNIRKNIIAIIAAFGSLASQAIATPLVRLAAGAIKQSTLRSRVVTQIKNTATELIEPLETELFLFKSHLRGTKLGKQAEEIFNECIQNKTMRKLVILKTGEWIFTMPGFILASQGDTQAIAGAAVIICQHGMYGIAANAALLSGAASYYTFECARKFYHATKENLNKNNQTDLMIWSA
jgi:predicted phage tail protein